MPFVSHHLPFVSNQVIFVSHHLPFVSNLTYKQMDKQSKTVNAFVEVVKLRTILCQPLVTS